MTKVDAIGAGIILLFAHTASAQSAGPSTGSEHPASTAQCREEVPTVDGSLVRCHSNGQLAEQGQLRDGKAVGLWRAWYDNGQKRREIEMVGGVPNGRLAVWDADGEPVVLGRIATRAPSTEPTGRSAHEEIEIECPPGRRPKTRTVIRYGMGSGSPPYATWCGLPSQNEALRPCRMMLNDNPPDGACDEGRVLVWEVRASGAPTPVYSHEYRRGRQHGRFVSWHDNGQKETLAQFKNGKRIGPSKRWDREGREILDVQD